MPAASVKVLKHGSGVAISTTAKRVQSTVAAAPGCAWAGELRLPTQTELVPIYALEAASYPADEAASEEGMQFRLAHAPTFFRAFYCTDAPHAPASAVQPAPPVWPPAALNIAGHLPTVPTYTLVCTQSSFGARTQNSSRPAARVYQWYSGAGRGVTPHCAPLPPVMPTSAAIAHALQWYHCFGHTG